MSKWFAFLILHLAVVITGHSVISADEHPDNYVIFDTDMGADDAWSLQMLLNAEKQLKSVKLLGITTVDGNTDVENVIKNTFHVLHGLNRTDIPIYKGSSEPIIPTNLKNVHYYGKNGFGDIDFWKPNYPSNVSSIVVPEKNAVEIIRDLVMKYPNKVTLLCLGPLTNIALAIKTFPEIKENIKEVFMMGGSFRGRGNIQPTGEFNFYHDPESVYVVLNSLKCPMTILPLEADDGLTISKKWRFSTFNKYKDDNVAFLNKIEEIAMKNDDLFLPFDTFTAAAFLFPERMIQLMNQYNATMELTGFHTRGQLIVDFFSTDYNVNIIERISEDEFKKIMLWTANYSYELL